jgi:putative transcriptional regulator
MSPIKLRISELMENQDMTVKDLAEKAHIAYNTALALKRGSMTRIDLETMDKLCELFKCEPGDLLIKQDKSA